MRKSLLDIAVVASAVLALAVSMAIAASAYDTHLRTPGTKAGTPRYERWLMNRMNEVLP